MRVYAPVMTRVEKPAVSGEYLTDLGKLYFNTETGRFSLDRTSFPISSFAVGIWYKEMEAHTAAELALEYARGCVDGMDIVIRAHSIGT